jgi:hypothetical protein
MGVVRKRLLVEISRIVVEESLNVSGWKRKSQMNTDCSSCLLPESSTCKAQKGISMMYF